MFCKLFPSEVMIANPLICEGAPKTKEIAETVFVSVLFLTAFVATHHVFLWLNGIQEFHS